MGYVNKTTLKVITAQGEKVYKLLNRRNVAAYTEGMEQETRGLLTDVAEISRVGIKPKLTSADIDRIIAMREAGLSQRVMARELGVGETTLRLFLQKHLHEYSDCRDKVIPALSKYFSANSKEAKEMAFADIDKYLQKLAKERVKNGGLSFEDCLQDLRLEFFELEKVRVAKGNSDAPNFYKAFLYRLQKEPVLPKVMSEARPLSSLPDSAKEIAFADSGIARFEAFNLGDFLLEMHKKSKWGLERGSFENTRMHYCIIEHIKEGKSADEIGEMFGLTKERIRSILEDAKKILQKKYDLAILGEDYQPNIDYYKKVVDEIKYRK